MPSWHITVLQSAIVTLYIDFSSYESGMTANKRTFEVDRFLTRQLLLRYPDNTPPSANQAIFTDGQGGTFYAALASSNVTATAFNAVFLADTGSTIIADLAQNTLTLQGGPGIRFQQGGAPYTIAATTSLLVPSTFTTISTAHGILTATNPSSILNIQTSYGVNAAISANTLVLSGNPGFGIINVSTPTGIQQIGATSAVSSILINPGFGILLGVSGPTLTIGNTASTYALNQVTFASTSYNFTNGFNTLNFSTSGNLVLSKPTPSTILFKTNSFSKVSTPAGNIYASTTGESLNISSGYGINYAINGTALQLTTSLPSSFSFISTARGTIGTPYSTNTLTLTQGYGIDYQVSDQNLTIKLASTYGSAIVTESGSTIATANSIFNLRQGDGILYSTATTGELYVRTTDFAKIQIRGGATIYSYNTILTTPVLNKTLTLIPGPGTQIEGNAATNAITITTFSSVQVTGPAYAYSYIQLYSTVSTIFDDPTSNTSFFWTSNAGVGETPYATFKFVGVEPIQVAPNNDPTQNLMYIGIDSATLLSSVNNELSILSTNVSTALSKLVQPYLSINTLSSQNVNTTAINASSFSLLGNVVLSSNPLSPSYLTVNQISTATGAAGILRISTINDTPLSTPLAVLNYSSNSIGINIGSHQPQANLEVNGVILAHTFATYSDSSLKNFTSPLLITSAELEKMRPWNFTWKADSLVDIGFAAEDVEKIAPSAVKRASNGLRIVDYSRLSAVAISALQDTNRRLLAVESTLIGIQT
jgi:hypothetical protein